MNTSGDPRGPSEASFLLQSERQEEEEEGEEIGGSSLNLVIWAIKFLSQKLFNSNRTRPSPLLHPWLCVCPTERGEIEKKPKKKQDNGDVGKLQGSSARPLSAGDSPVSGARISEYLCFSAVRRWPPEPCRDLGAVLAWQGALEEVPIVLPPPDPRSLPGRRHCVRLVFGYVNLNNGAREKTIIFTRRDKAETNGGIVYSRVADAWLEVPVAAKWRRLTSFGAPGVATN